MKILEATQKDSHVLAQMAAKIWDNENVDELEEEFTEILQSDEESNRIICFKKNL